MLKQMMWTKSRNFLFLLQYWLMFVLWRQSCIILRRAAREGEASCMQHWRLCRRPVIGIDGSVVPVFSPGWQQPTSSIRCSQFATRHRVAVLLQDRQRPVSPTRPETRRSLSTRHQSCTGGYSIWSLNRPGLRCIRIDYFIGISPVITRQIIWDQDY